MNGFGRDSNSQWSSLIRNWTLQMTPTWTTDPRPAWEGRVGAVSCPFQSQRKAPLAPRGLDFGNCQLPSTILASVSTGAWSGRGLRLWGPAYLSYPRALAPWRPVSGEIRWRRDHCGLQGGLGRADGPCGQRRLDLIGLRYIALCMPDTRR